MAANASLDLFFGEEICCHTIFDMVIPILTYRVGCQHSWFHIREQRLKKSVEVIKNSLKNPRQFIEVI